MKEYQLHLPKWKAKNLIAILRCSQDYHWIKDFDTNYKLPRHLLI